MANRIIEKVAALAKAATKKGEGAVGAAKAAGSSVPVMRPSFESTPKSAKKEGTKYDARIRKTLRDGGLVDGDERLVASGDLEYHKSGRTETNKADTAEWLSKLSKKNK